MIKNENYEKAKSFFEKGLYEFEKNNYIGSETYFKASLELINDRLSTITNLIAVLLKQDKYDEAQKYINIGLRIDDKDEVLLLNKGIYELKVNNLNSALSLFQIAVKINPQYYEAYSNIGSVYKLLNNIDSSIQNYSKALNINPKFIDALYNRANLFLKIGQYKKAIKDFEAAININYKYPDLFASYLGCKMQVCDWSDYEKEKEKLKNNIKNKIPCSPFSLLSLFDSPELHYQAACNFAESEITSDERLKIRNYPIKNNKIRIGYYSADFHNHATSYLMAEIFEMHDKKSFEIYAFSYGPNYNDEMRNRISQSFHKFIDISNNSDFEIALMSRNLKINIAIDLKGYTGGQRCGIFKNRCAPIQINYLGYPGTLGSKVYDYIIADKVLIPENLQSNYIEKIIYLPNSYQPNDSKRIISLNKTTKKEHNLPTDSFIFCSFNNTFKILPETFIVWLNILKKNTNSILWLINDNNFAVENLKKFAFKYKVNPQRLIFAKRTKLSQHLERHEHADLFLDTFPYNAHTTASDSLWAGLPVLTYAGQSFASRVSASLLTSSGLPEFITHSYTDYENKAIEFSKNTNLINKTKDYLKENKLKNTLFNSNLYTKNLEKAYVHIYENYLNGLQPEHIYIESI